MTGASPLDAYQAVLAVAEQQLAAVQDDQLEEYLRLVEVRDVLVAALPTQVSGADRDQARRLLTAIMAIDEECRQRLRCSLEAVRQSLRDLRRGRQAVRGYGAQAAAWNGAASR